MQSGQDENREIKPSLKADSIRKECEASLRRLKVDVIDLYQIHWPQPEEDIEEGWGALAKLKQEGKVRWIGVSNFDAKQMERIQKIAPITSLQPPYSAISPEIETETLPYCQQHNVGVIVYSPMKSGLLTGKMTRERVNAFPADDFRRKALAFQEPNLTRNLALQDLMTDIGKRHGRAAGEVAIAWVLLESGSHSGNRRHAFCRPGEGCLGCARVSVERGRDRRDRPFTPKRYRGLTLSCLQGGSARKLLGRFRRITHRAVS